MTVLDAPRLVAAARERWHHAAVSQDRLGNVSVAWSDDDTFLDLAFHLDGHGVGIDGEGAATSPFRQAWSSPSRPLIGTHGHVGALSEPRQWRGLAYERRRDSASADRDLSESAGRTARQEYTRACRPRGASACCLSYLKYPGLILKLSCISTTSTSGMSRCDADRPTPCGLL
ncbi:hypothetical protein [Cellulomonas xiejunii]|uniref:hypothetical protein n=1 Tax=Cellulomonas xiejunii TaxID=2968083 RepID=UPI001D0F39CC|nr:hypothetical protein [Cellulomonas xiejunii]